MTLRELEEAACYALSVDYRGQSNGQVSELPNIRAIRYYTSLGLLARPAEMRGRTALYAEEHLHQLVAIKRLQAQGLSLIEIQQRFVTFTKKDLAELAAIPPKEEMAKLQDRQAEAFWEQQPVALSVAEPEPSSIVRQVQVLEFAPGVQLHIEGKNLNKDELRDLERASSALLEVLGSIGLD